MQAFVAPDLRQVVWLVERSSAERPSPAASSPLGSAEVPLPEKSFSSPLRSSVPTPVPSYVQSEVLDLDTIDFWPIIAPLCWKLVHVTSA